ncbi:MAG: DinB family protein [Bacteroidia bacterium]
MSFKSQSETTRIAHLYKELYNGHPWIDLTLFDTLQQISAAQAKRHPYAQCHSIWEIVNHIISWRLVILSRVKGSLIEVPDSNFFETISDTSVKAWKETLKKLDDSQTQWMKFLNDLEDEKLIEQFPSGFTRYDLIHAILHHDAYHLGQVVMLMKAV